MFYFRGTRKPDFKKIEKINYDEYWKTRGFALRSRLMEREIIFFDWIKTGSKVLDVGCGNSRLLYELKNRKDCVVTGLDTSPLVIEGQKQSGISAQVMDIESPKFILDQSYDYIIASELLEHLRQPEDFIRKLAPHAKFLVISVPNSAFYRYRLGLMFGGRFFTQWRYHPSEHLRFWSHRDFTDWLEAMGLRLVDWRASNGFFGKDVWPNMLGHQMCYLAETPIAIEEEGVLAGKAVGLVQTAPELTMGRNS